MYLAGNWLNVGPASLDGYYGYEQEGTRYAFDLMARSDTATGEMTYFWNNMTGDINANVPEEMQHLFFSYRYFCPDFGAFFSEFTYDEERGALFKGAVRSPDLRGSE